MVDVAALHESFGRIAQAVCLCALPAALWVLGVVWLHGRGVYPVRRLCGTFRGLRGVPAALAVAALVAWAGTKPDSGSPSPRGLDSAPREPGDALASAGPNMGGGWAAGRGEPAVAVGAFALVSAATNAVHDFSMPANAAACERWLRRGAARDWFAVTNDLTWAFPFGTSAVRRITVSSTGAVLLHADPVAAAGERALRVALDSRGGVPADAALLAPLRARLGVVPRLNWGRAGCAGSCFWSASTPSNTLLLTWRNVLLGRSPEKPVSFQVELTPGGRFRFAYDLSSATEDDLASDVLAGAFCGDRRVAVDPPPGAVSVFDFHVENPVDTDGDGLNDAEEMVYGTDPELADTDGDGLGDHDEVRRGTNPVDPDTDADGLADGEEVARGTNPLAADTDGDGLGDGLEAEVYGSDPLVADSDGDGIGDAAEAVAGTSPVLSDTDGDGLSDAAERAAGTNPLLKDTDGDGATDGEEVSAGSDPLAVDTDGDGLPDGEELNIGSSPLLLDTDGDGFTDPEEVALGTDPASADTDGDGIPDGEESVAGTDPRRADTDGDGLVDGDEFTVGTSPWNPDCDGDGLPDGDEIDAGTDPLDADSDGDGMPDGWEVRYGLNPLQNDASRHADSDGLTNLREYRLGTDPTKNDTDGDGLDDGLEADIGTSPAHADTDGDGLDDGAERRGGTSPLNADTDGDGLPDGWEAAHDLDPTSSVGLHGASGDPDDDGLANLEECRLGTHPRKADTDGDGIPDGEEAGYTRAETSEAEWASTTNGWSVIDAEYADELDGVGISYYDLGDRGLSVGREGIAELVVQGNGILFLNTERHNEEGLVDYGPCALSSYYQTNAALLLAPCWVSPGLSNGVSSVRVLCRTNGAETLIAVQDDGMRLLAAGTDTLSVQTVLEFTNGVFRSSEFSYRNMAIGNLSSISVGIGVQNRVRRVCREFGFQPIADEARYAILQVAGTGTDPAKDDSDGDGLTDEEERRIGTDPFQPDTDGDGMNDGWEQTHGFNPRKDNAADGDPTNDYDHDSDGDGLTNGEECEWGTDPHSDDTDGDGATDKDEIENGSDPTDPNDGGIPASRVPVSFTFGDPSGSHSEKYRLVLKPVAESGRGETPPTKSWLNENYGECETKTAMLARGWTYEITLHHAGTNIEDGSPDYDYLLSWSVPSCCGCVTNDLAGLICKDYTSDSFAGEGKVAKILVLDGGIWADYNRVDGIDSYDKSKAYRGRPLRHWYNDDDDEGPTNEGLGDIPAAGSTPDCANNHVDGRCDVLDFTPVWIDMGAALDGMARQLGKDCALTLSHEDGAVNLVWTSLAKDTVADFLKTPVGNCGRSLAADLASADTVRLTKDELELPENFVDLMRGDRNKGIILIEGRSPGGDSSVASTSPLVLRVYGKPRASDAVPLCELRLPLSLSSVEEMYRWVDLRHVLGVADCIPSRLGIPSNLPDSECDGRNYVFVHGYNVGKEDARGWASEMFKRLRQSGSQSMFTAVDWYGDHSQFEIPFYDKVSPDYYRNVEHAFRSSPAFVSQCAALPGAKVMLAHSLGNMLVSSAAVDHGLAYERYCMINAAVPMEAYDDEAYAPQMIDRAWKSVNSSLWASHWGEQFEEGDFRRTLSWKGRFAGIQNAVNFYSSTEDVLQNPQSRGLGGAWAKQELFKGVSVWKGINGLHIENISVACEGGWGINPYFAIRPDCYLPLKGFIGLRFRGYSDSVARPLFTPFADTSLHRNGFDGRVDDILRARMLGAAIPAESFAAGANPLHDRAKVVNYDMAAHRQNGSPRLFSDDWLHSDIKNVAFYHVYPIFEQIIQGTTKEERK